MDLESLSKIELPVDIRDGFVELANLILEDPPVTLEDFIGIFEDAFPDSGLADAVLLSILQTASGMGVELEDSK